MRHGGPFARAIELTGSNWWRPGRSRPLIVVNPTSDDAFRERIDRHLATGVVRPSDLEALLRIDYPRTVVRRRELTDEEIEIWYVYRDGHWIGGNE
jgi:hypothetical protein